MSNIARKRTHAEITAGAASGSFDRKRQKSDKRVKEDRQSSAGAQPSETQNVVSTKP